MRVFSTTDTTVQSLIAEVQGSLQAIPTFLLYFHSSDFSAATVASALEQAFPGVPALGCSTAGELITGKMQDHSLVLAAFDAAQVADARVEAIEGLDIKQAFDKLSGGNAALDLGQYVGLILMDGLSGNEELLMDALGNCTDLTFVGGSAGDDLKFSKTDVAANGKTVAGAGALALLHVPGGFDLIKTQSFCTTGKTLVPSKVDRASRSVLEFDGKPALQAYAAALGVAPEQASTAFMTSPLGLMAGAEPFVRSPQRVEGDKLHFYCAVHEGVELALLQGTDIIADTEKALAASRYSALVVFNCILRTLDLKNQGKTAEFGSLFSAPTIGFSTYGEAFIGHINQTATILALR
jgi:hypothetical protein